jgi:hypothetical protein
MQGQMLLAPWVAVIAANIAHFPTVLAADQPSQAVAFYALGIGLDGSATVGNATADIDVSFSEVLDHLDWAAMGGYRYQTESWSMRVDMIYASLTGEQTGSGGLTRAKVALDQAMIEIDGGYRLNENLELLVGLRYWDYDTDIALFIPNMQAVQVASDESWIDPLIGAHLTLPIGSNWEFVARGDIGGFGVGSDFAWQVTAFFNWTVGENFGVLFGYRFFDFDFEDDSGSDRKAFDMQQGGPAVGVSFAF